MAGYGRTWLGVDGHWLPTRLPEIPLAWLMFDRSNSLSTRAQNASYRPFSSQVGQMPTARPKDHLGASPIVFALGLTPQTLARSASGRVRINPALGCPWPRWSANGIQWPDTPLGGTPPLSVRSICPTSHQATVSDIELQDESPLHAVGTGRILPGAAVNPRSNARRALAGWCWRPSTRSRPQSRCRRCRGSRRRGGSVLLAG
jgi:hypothetical protein